jgi:hypothetical protein
MTLVPYISSANKAMIPLATLKASVNKAAYAYNAVFAVMFS